MTNPTYFDTKLSKEGRMVVPAAVRRALGAHAGDTIRLSLDDAGSVRLLTAQNLADEIWANNTKPGADKDAVADVRAARKADRLVDDRSFELQQSAADNRSASEIADDVYAALGLGG